MNDEIAAERDALAGASDQAEYGAPAEYGAASAPVGDYEAAVEEARRGRRVGGRRGGQLGNISLFSENISFFSLSGRKGGRRGGSRRGGTVELKH